MEQPSQYLDFCQLNVFEGGSGDGVVGVSTEHFPWI